jgi:hypothetical protein
MTTNEARTKALDAVRELSRVTTETEAEHLRRLAAYEVQFAAKQTEHDALFARVKALGAENAALKRAATGPVVLAATDVWCDMPTYSYRRTGDVLLVAYKCAGKWTAGRFGDASVSVMGGPETDTRDEAKAILDAAVKPAPVKPRYVAEDAKTGGDWYVKDNCVIIGTTHTKRAAEMLATALNADAQAKP